MTFKNPVSAEIFINCHLRVPHERLLSFFPPVSLKNLVASLLLTILLPVSSGDGATKTFNHCEYLKLGFGAGIYDVENSMTDSFGTNIQFSVLFKPFHRTWFQESVYAGVYAGLGFEIYEGLRGIDHISSESPIFSINIPVSLRIPDFTYIHAIFTLYPLFYFHNSAGFYIFFGTGLCAGIRAIHLCAEIFPVDMWGEDKLGGLRGSIYFTILDF